VAAIAVGVTALVGADVAAADPDLRVTRFSYQPVGTTSGVVGAGAMLRVSERTRNAGSSFARKSTTRYFLDDQPLRPLGRRSVEALAPGGSASIIEEIPIPSAVPPGTYRLFACADGVARIRESSERNNCRTASRTLRVRANARDAVFIGGGAQTGAVIAATEGVPALLAPDLTVTDADDTQLTGALVRVIGGGPDAGVVGGAGLDWFFFTNQRGITGTYNSGTGVLTLTGTASVADYQGALRSVWYEFKGDDPAGTRKVEVRARDAAGVWSNRARATLTVMPVNDAPSIAVSTPDGPQLIAHKVVLYDPDGPLAGATVRIGSGFSSGDVLAFSSQRGITGTYDSGTGVLTLTGNASVSDYEAALRSISYTSTNPGNRTFVFQVRDGAGADSSAVVLEYNFNIY
jgi:hypothetical protein